MLIRALQSTIQNRLLTSSKIVVLYGPRQVGKTTLVRQVLPELPGRKLEINADESRYLDVLSSRDLNQLRQLVVGGNGAFKRSRLPKSYRDCSYTRCEENCENQAE